MLVQIKPCNKSKTTNFNKVWLYLKKNLQVYFFKPQTYTAELFTSSIRCGLLLQPPSAKCHMTNKFPPPQECIYHFTELLCRWGLVFFPLTLKGSWFCTRGVHRAVSAAWPMQRALILPHLCWLGWLLAPLGVPWPRAGAPWLAGVPEEPAESVLQGPVTSQGGCVATSQVLWRGGSDVGEVPAAKSSLVISEQNNTSNIPAAHRTLRLGLLFRRKQGDGAARCLLDTSG